ncbi:MAG TPA: NAD(P)/FAD-dependent oxidoreductase [Gemmatimonadales bacterium]
MPEIAIVGGGILGMTLALRLQGEGRQVTILEAAPETGGLTITQEIAGYTWDRFYHVILLSDTNLRGLLDELDLSGRLRWGTTRTGFYCDGALYSLSDTLEFLRFPPLSLVDKARLAGTILYASRLRDWKALERIPVTDWLRRLSGTRTTERIWLPLLRSKLGENYRQASAAFIWAIIARMYAARRSGLKREQFGYVEGGYDTILRAFRARLQALGVRTLAGRRVSRVRDLGDRVVLEFDGANALEFDSAILTVPCGQVAAVCPDLTAAERDRLGRVVYQGIVCASLLLRRPLADFYITNITDDQVPYTAVIEMTALVNRATFGGNALVYLPRYLTQEDPFWQLPDSGIREVFLDGLRRMYPAFEPADLLAFQVARVREMLAVSTLNYSEAAMPAVRTTLRNVFVVNSAQIPNGTLNVNETIGLAESTAPMLRGVLGPRPALGAPR